MLQLALLALALAAALLVRPWRLLRSSPDHPGFLTPALAALTLLAWLWAWPGQSGMPLPLQWSGAPLAVLLLGWPLAVPVFLLAAASTVFTAGASWSEAVAAAACFGLLPGTATLALGRAIRRAFGTHPVAYLAGRAWLSTLLVVGLCSLANGGMQQVSADLRWVAALLVGMGEASWTCGAAALLVAYRPLWLATWSDRLYLGPPPRRRLRI